MGLKAGASGRAGRPCSGGSFPNNILFGAPERGGIGISSFADEVNVSRVLALFQHIRGNKTERELACAAVKSSELLTQEDVPVLERIGPRWITHEWDQTWTGRIAEFCIEPVTDVTSPC